MPNPIKYSLTTQPNTIKSGNFVIGVNKGGYGPTSTTNYYNGKTPNVSGYTVYIANGISSPPIYVAANDTELIGLSNYLGGSGITTIGSALSFFNSSSTMTCVNVDYSNIVTDGLVLNLDAGFTPSYPRSGTTWNDISGNGNNGTLVNGVGYDSSNDGSLVFDGVDDYVTIPSSEQLKTLGLQNFTISLWVKRTTVPPGGNGEMLFVNSGVGGGNGGGIVIGIASTTCRIELRDNSGQATAITAEIGFQANTWTNVVVVKVGTSIIIYSQGVIKSTINNLYQNISTTRTTVELGRVYWWDGGYWEGNISTTQIYNRALSASEILQNYYAGLQRFIPTDGLVLWLDAQNTNRRITNPTIANDMSGNNNNGDMFNGTSLSRDGGTSFSFDGVDDGLMVPSQITNYIPTSGNFTIIGWINRNSTTIPLGDRESIFSNTGNADGFRFQISSSGLLVYLIGGVLGAGYSEGSIGSGYNVADGNWHQVGVMFDRTGQLGSYKVYAVFDGTIIGSTPIASTNDVFTSNPAGISYYCCSKYKGKVATLSVYNRLLTATEILTIYTATKSRYGL